jgi:hypothetical protein
MAQQRRRPQAPNSIPVAAPPEEEAVPTIEATLQEPEESSPVIPTTVGMVETKEQPARPLVAVPKGLILKQDDPITIDGLDMGQFVIVKQDIYREVYPYGSRRPSYYLLYHRGQQVPKSMLVKK